MDTHSTTDELGVRRVWNVERLWALAKDLTPSEIPVEDLRRYLDQDCWFGGRTVTTREVAEHARKIYEADLSYPIILNHWNGLMDGTHRLAKAWLLRHATILAVRFLATPAPDEVHQSPGPQSS